MSSTYKYLQENDTYTNVSINKTIEGTESYPRFNYKIKIPKIDYFEFILALDSSGSLDFGGSEGKYAVISAVPEFLKGIPNTTEYKNKNFKLAIISWDDNIDFAYGDFNNTDPKKAILRDINKTIADIDIYDLFGEKNITQYNYRCYENEYTNFSQAIGASIDIFKNEYNEKKENDFNRTERFIILVTDKSEFDRCTTELINETRLQSWEVYSIGLAVDPRSRMRDHLAELSNCTDCKDKVQLVRGVKTEKELKDGLVNALNQALATAVKDPAAENVTISETVYSYFIPDENSVRVNGTQNKDAVRKVINQNNSDGTTTFAFELAKGLDPDSTTEVTFDARLNLVGLPLSPPGEFPLPSANKTTPLSYFRYTWFNGQSFTSLLRDNKINIIASPLTTSTARSFSTPSASISSKSSDERPWYYFIKSILGQ